MPTTKGTKTKADLAKELASLRDNFIMFVQKIQERDKVIEDVFVTLVNKFPVKDVQEIEHDEKELFEKFKPLINLYGVEKETGDFIKVIPVTDSWIVDNVKEPTEEEKSAVFTFKKDDQIKEIKAANYLEAWSILRKDIISAKSTPVKTESIPTPKMEIVK
jgi:hypothetical protein